MDRLLNGTSSHAAEALHRSTSPTASRRIGRNRHGHLHAVGELRRVASGIGGRGGDELAQIDRQGEDHHEASPAARVGGYRKGSKEPLPFAETRGVALSVRKEFDDEGGIGGTGERA